jgi:hypothetical protein
MQRNTRLRPVAAAFQNLYTAPMKRIAGLLCVFCAALGVHAQTIRGGDTVCAWSAGLRIREGASASARISGTAGLWEKLRVLDVSGEVLTIAGNRGSWVHIRRQDGRSGYCFSYFLVPVHTDGFFPVLAYNQDTGEIYTFYNDRRGLDKLSLFWEGQSITRFPGMEISALGTAIAFTWLDPRSVRRPKPGTYTGTRVLFVYEFSTHRLVKVDEAFISESDRQSEYWKQKLSEMDGDSISFSAAGFIRDRQLDSYCLNREGSRIFYYTGRSEAVEVDLATGGRKRHKVRSEFYWPQYIGAYVYLDYTRAGDSRHSYRMLYDPARERVVCDDLFDWNPQTGEGFALLNILRDRYLFVAKDAETYFLRDMRTDAETQIPLTGIFRSPPPFDGETAWLVDVSSSGKGAGFTHQSVHIQKVDYTGKAVSRLSYNFPLDEKTSSIHSFLRSSFAGGIMLVNEFQNRDGYFAWAYYLLHDGSVKNFRLTADGLKFYDHVIYYAMKGE